MFRQKQCLQNKGTFIGNVRYPYRPCGARTLPEPKLRTADGSPQARKPGGNAGLFFGDSPANWVAHMSFSKAIRVCNTTACARRIFDRCSL